MKISNALCTPYILDEYEFHLVEHMCAITIVAAGCDGVMMEAASILKSSF